jgi:large subunit ribosomal protein L24e
VYGTPSTFCSLDLGLHVHQQVEASTQRRILTIDTANLMHHSHTNSGKGRLYVRGDNKVFRFVSSKNESLFLQRKNPRKIAWTTVYRRLHKKGVTEEVAKKRSRKTVKHQRGIVGASLDVINARRNQKPEVRAAARQAAIAKSKEDKKSKAEARKATKAKSVGAGGAGPQISRQQMKGGAGKGRV